MRVLRCRYVAAGVHAVQPTVRLGYIPVDAPNMNGIFSFRGAIISETSSKGLFLH